MHGEAIVFLVENIQPAALAGHMFHRAGLDLNDAVVADKGNQRHFSGSGGFIGFFNTAVVNFERIATRRGFKSLFARQFEFV